MSKVVVTGATGKLGRLVIESLVTKVQPTKIAVSVRNVARAEDLFIKGLEFRYGDYEDSVSLVRSFIGAPKLLMISTPAEDPLSRIQQELRIIDAAVMAGVQHIYYTSLSGALPPLLLASRSVEYALFSTGIPVTIFRNAYYQDAFINDRLVQYALGEIILTSSGNGKINTVSRADLAEAIATVFAEDGHENKIYTLASPKSWSFADLARIISKITDKNVRFETLAEEQLRPIFEKTGMPETSILTSLELFHAMNNGDLDKTSGDLSYILGRAPETIEESVRKFFDQQNVV